jgi:hypothetical protein
MILGLFSTILCIDNSRAILTQRCELTEDCRLKTIIVIYGSGTVTCHERVVNNGSYPSVRVCSDTDRERSHDGGDRCAACTGSDTAG